jgi:hypothetical protein
MKAKTIAAPGPIEIENELAKLRAGTGPFYRCIQLGWGGDAVRLADLLIWVVPVSPENVELLLWGGGETPAEAAAAAWVVNALYRDWWEERGPLTEAEYLAVPRRVPPGWEFDIIPPDRR